MTSMPSTTFPKATWVSPKSGLGEREMQNWEAPKGEEMVPSPEWGRVEITSFIAWSMMEGMPEPPWQEEKESVRWMNVPAKHGPFAPVHITRKFSAACTVMSPRSCTMTLRAGLPMIEMSRKTWGLAA